MKKMIALLLACLMVFGLMACAETKDEPSDDAGVSAQLPAETETEQPGEEETEQPSEEETEQPEGADAETPEQTQQPGDASDDASSSETGSPALQTILDTLLDDLDAEFIPYYASYGVTAEDAPYVVGYEEMDTGFEAALGYGPMMGSTAFIMTLFQLPEDADAEAFAADLAANADLNKWICVSADYADGVANGRYVMFLMASQEACPDTVRQELASRFAAIDTAALAG